MTDIRAKRAKLNIVVSLACQLISILCGLVIPRLMISAFGSEAYGATASIVQFLAYITLLEGGIGGVARAALYRPLAENDSKAISAVVYEIKRFFRAIAYIFAGYVLVVACSFKSISDLQYLDWTSTFLLVIIISASTFGQYFIGISNSLLLQASQKSYITNAVSITATILNTIATITLIYAGCSLIIVKFVSSFIFIMRPIVLWLYVRKYYNLVHKTKSEKKYLTQKWEGLGQHLAYFLYSNTDIVVLTVFANLNLVAVYSVYNLVVSHMQSIVISFTSGMEAIFGDMLAKKESENIHKTFGYYETLISVACMILFGTTVVMIVPFVEIYTSGITDTNYVVPTFAVLLVFTSVIYCLRSPYHAVTIAAGHFRQTRTAAYGEAIINIAMSIIMVNHLGLVGVAIGTMVATLFRFIYYVAYLSNHIINRPPSLFVKRLITNGITFLIIFMIGKSITDNAEIASYIEWMFVSVFVVIMACIVTFTANYVMYNREFKSVLNKYCKKL